MFELTDMGIVLFQDSCRKLSQLTVYDVKSLSFKARDDLADTLSFHAVGLEDDQCLFHDISGVIEVEKEIILSFPPIQGKRIC